MSMRQVLDTTMAMMREQLRDRVEAFAAAHAEITGTPGPLSADFNFVEWALPGEAAPATCGNIMLAPITWNGWQNPGASFADATVEIEIAFETFGASTTDVQNELTLVHCALLQMLYDLVDYARANGGTIYEVSSVAFRFAEHRSPLAGGWFCTVTLLERSTE